MDCPSVDYTYTQIYSGGVGSGIWGDDPPFDSVYPYRLDLPITTTDVLYEWKPTDYEYPDDGDLVSTVPEVAGNEVIAVKAYYYMNTFLSADYEVCYYVVRPFSDSLTYLHRITQDDVLRLQASGMPDPFNLSLDFDSETGGFLTFLHDFGQVLISNNPLPDIFDIEINGVSLLGILFGSGFFLFCVWTVAKWVI